MTYAYRVAPKGYLLVALAALKFAQEQPAIGNATRRKIALAVASAQRDLAKLEGKRPKRSRKGRRSSPG